MDLSKRWLQDYVDIDVPDRDFADKAILHDIFGGKALELLHTVHHQDSQDSLVAEQIHNMTIQR